MKRTFFLLLASLSATVVIGQTSQTPASDSVISAPRQPSSQQRELGNPTLTFTNQTGDTFSVADLESRLKTLHTSIEQTLPMVIAYNQSFGSGSGTTEGISGVLSKVLSGRDKKSEEEPSDRETAEQGQGSSLRSNVVGILRGLLNTNAPSSVTVSAETLADLRTLEKELGVVLPTLQRLNAGDDSDVVTGSSTNGLPSTTRSVEPTSESGLTPTGRTPESEPERK